MTDTQRVVDFLMNRIKGIIREAGSAKRMSPVQKAAVMIIARMIVHQAKDDRYITISGMAMITQLGLSEWPKQPVVGSMTELVYRAN